MKRFNENNYITIPGFAIVRLKLKGNELLAYSLIYGFCQDPDTEYQIGTMTYLSEALGLTDRGVRKVLGRLEEAGYITRTYYHVGTETQVTYKVNSKYLTNDPPVAERSAPEQSSGTPLNKVPVPPEQSSGTPISRYNDIIDDKNNIRLREVEKFSYEKFLTSHGVPEDLARDYMEVRRKKKASNTPTAAAALEREARKAGLSIEEAVRLCTENSWQGFRAEYVQRGSARPARMEPGMVSTFDVMIESEKEMRRLRAEREARERNTLGL